MELWKDGSIKSRVFLMPVTTPAYPDTDVVVSARSKEIAERVAKPEVDHSIEIELMKMEAELM